MMPKVLAETTLDPAKRTIVRIGVNDEPAANRVLMELMGKDVQARFDFIMSHAATVDEIDV
jgi:DNA gyrase/topoisomerase IV subunit B